MSGRNTFPALVVATTLGYLLKITVAGGDVNITPPVGFACADAPGEWAPHAWQLLLLVSEYFAALLEFTAWTSPSYRAKVVAFAQKFISHQARFPADLPSPSCPTFRSWATFTFSYFCGIGHISDRAQVAVVWMQWMVGTQGWREKGPVFLAAQHWTKSTWTRLLSSTEVDNMQPAVVCLGMKRVTEPRKDKGEDRFCAVSEAAAAPLAPSSPFLAVSPYRTSAKDGRAYFKHMKIKCEVKKGCCGVPAAEGNNCTLSYLIVADVMAAFLQAQTTWTKQEPSRSDAEQAAVVQAFRNGLLHSNTSSLCAKETHNLCQQQGYFNVVHDSVRGWDLALQQVQAWVKDLDSASGGKPPPWLVDPALQQQPQAAEGARGTAAAAGAQKYQQLDSDEHFLRGMHTLLLAMPAGRAPPVQLLHSWDKQTVVPAEQQQRSYHHLQQQQQQQQQLQQQQQQPNLAYPPEHQQQQLHVHRQQPQEEQQQQQQQQQPHSHHYWQQKQQQPPPPLLQQQQQHNVAAYQQKQSLMGRAAALLQPNLLQLQQQPQLLGCGGMLPAASWNNNFDNIQPPVPPVANSFSPMASNFYITTSPPPRPSSDAYVACMLQQSAAGGAVGLVGPTGLSSSMTASLNQQQQCGTRGSSVITDAKGLAQGWCEAVEQLEGQKPDMAVGFKDSLRQQVDAIRGHISKTNLQPGRSGAAGGFNGVASSSRLPPEVAVTGRMEQQWPAVGAMGAVCAQQAAAGNYLGGSGMGGGAGMDTTVDDMEFDFDDGEWCAALDSPSSTAPLDDYNDGELEFDDFSRLLRATIRKRPAGA